MYYNKVFNYQHVCIGLILEIINVMLPTIGLISNYNCNVSIGLTLAIIILILTTIGDVSNQRPKVCSCIVNVSNYISLILATIGLMTATIVLMLATIHRMLATIEYNVMLATDFASSTSRTVNNRLFASL